jgi:hypothetical protein
MPKEAPFEQKLFPASPALSPAAVVGRFNGALNKYGQKTVFEDKRFQKARELWIGSVFSLGLTKLTKQRYWVVPDYSETPDLYLTTLVPHRKYKDSDTEVRSLIEVTEWEEHSCLSLSKQILKKLAGKNYPEHYILLVYIKRCGQVVNMDKVFQELQEHALPLLEVWALSPSLSVQGCDHALFALHPIKTRSNFNLKNEVILSRNVQVDMLEIKRRKGRNMTIEGIKTFIYPELEN